MNDRTAPSGKQRQNYKWFLKIVIVLFVCGLAGFLAPFGALMILVLVLLLSVSTPQTKWLAKMAILLFFCGAVAVHIHRGGLTGLTFLFLSYIAVPIMGITSSAIQLHSKPSCGRVTHIFFIVFLSGILLIGARTFVILASPYVYMPPAITSENLKVYKECIRYVRSHDELKDLIFYMQGVVSGRKEPNESEITSTIETVERVSNRPEIATIAKQLAPIMCPRFERRDDIIIFYKGNNPFIPMTAKEIWHIWPSGHGVAYSLNGRDPNQSDDQILAKYRPFIKVHGNWYLSRGLLMNGDGRQYHSIPAISKTLIDSSLYLDDIDPNKLEGCID